MIRMSNSFCTEIRMIGHDVMTKKRAGSREFAFVNPQNPALALSRSVSAPPETERASVYLTPPTSRSRLHLSLLAGHFVQRLGQLLLVRQHHVDRFDAQSQARQIRRVIVGRIQ